jgi:hypothetical protein
MRDPNKHVLYALTYTSKGWNDHAHYNNTFAMLE